MEKETVLYLAIGLVFGFILSYIYKLFNNYKISGRVFSHKYSTSRLASSNSNGDNQLSLADYADILTDIELGILVFNRHNKLIYFNSISTQMLGDFSSTCSDLEDFFSQYGSNNGLLANYFLHKRGISGVYVVDNRSFIIRLHSSTSDNTDLNIVSIYDITQRENLEMQRKLFLANVSHELKTPLTTIVSYTESLMDWGVREQSQIQTLKDIRRIHDDGVRMQKLVNNLSLLTSIDSRGIRPLMDELDVGHLIKYCCDSLQLVAKEKQIVLSYSIQSGIPLIFAERASIERIIYNLVENAIKYTPFSGKVKIYLSHLHDEIIIKVSDTGIGIDEANLPLVFNRFYRVDNSGSAVLGGTGLGLSIAKELAELHNGRITVSSKIKLGTEFIVFLPTAPKIMAEAIELRDRDANDIPVIMELAQIFIAGELGLEGDRLALRDFSEVGLQAFLRQYKDHLVTDLQADQISLLDNNNQDLDSIQDLREDLSNNIDSDIDVIFENNTANEQRMDDTLVEKQIPLQDLTNINVDNSDSLEATTISKNL